MSAATFSGSNTTHYLCAILNHLSGMKSSFSTGKALN